MSLRQIGIALSLIFVAVLAVVVAKQMSTEAMAVVIGIVCGVSAGIPTSVLLLVVMTRRDRHRLEELEQRARRAEHSYPPVVVIQGGTPQALPSGQQTGYWPVSQPGPLVQREFREVGGDELLLDDERAWGD